MKKPLLLLFLLLSFFPVCNGQDLLRFSGKVTNMAAEDVPGADIYLLNTHFRTLTDHTGSFAFEQIPEGAYTLQVKALGYATVHQRIILSDSSISILVQLQETSKQLDAVTVTAQKKEEELQHVPLSISTLSAEQVEALNLRTIQEISAIVPNLYLANPGDNRNVTSIRGITTTSYDPAVATYIDGVNQFGLDTYMAQLLDVEQIEVLRGPQGTLYGRNAMGGVIHIITKQPTNTTSGFVKAELGNFDQQRYSAGIRAPLLNDKLFIGAAGLYGKQAGYYTNQFNNSDFDRQRYAMGNYYLTYLASPRLVVTLNVKHNQNRNFGAFPLAATQEQAFAEPFQVNQDAVTEMKDNTFNSSLSFSYAGQNLNFTSQSAYQSNYRFYEQPIDGDFSPLDAIAVVNNYGRDWNRVRVLTQEFRFTSTASLASPLQWTLGAYGSYRDNPVKQGVHFGEDAAMVGAPFPYFTSISTNKSQDAGMALFGQATYQVTSSLELTAGLRYDREHKKLRVRGEFQIDGDEAMVTLPDTATTANFSALSPKATLAYQLTEHHNLYTSFSRGFRTGGITQLSSDPSQPPLYTFKPEYSNNYELGFKSRFRNNRLRANIVAFYTTVEDVQVPTLILPDALTVTRNAGGLKSTGIEVELHAVTALALEIAYSVGYTHATYTGLALASGGETVDLQGNRQIFTPDLTSMLALHYTYTLGPGKKYKLTARGEWKYLGEHYFDLENTLKQSSYNLLNARLGVATGRLEAFLWGNNLSDKKYIAYAYNFGATRLGNPRNYGITVLGRF